MQRPAAGAFVVFVLLAAGCGATAVADSEDVAGAGAALESAGTARVESVTRFSDDAVGAPEFRWTGVVDYANDRSSYVFEPSGCRTIALGDVWYSEVPESEWLPAGKRWVRGRDAAEESVDGEALFEESLKGSESGGVIVWSTSVGIAADEPRPDEYLEHLAEYADGARVVGEEEVRGVRTTRYRGTLDMRRVLRRQLESEGWKPVNIERYLEDQIGTRELELWIGADGLLRRIVSTDRWPGEPGFHDTVTTTEYFDFGVEATLEPPPAGEVMDSDEWERLADAAMEEELERFEAEVDDGIWPLPGRFEADTGPTSCRG